MKLIFVAFIFVAIAAKADAKKRCYPVTVPEPTIIVDPPPVPVCTKKFEEYTECGTACPLKCGEPVPIICTANCVPGCFCQSGYARDNSGNCVLPIDCPQPTPVCSKKFEEYKECGPATGCVRTCDKPNGGICTKQCVAGCFCQDGFVRDKNQDCILLKNCPAKTCGRNEEWTDCNKMCGDAVNRCEYLINKVACKPSGCTSGCICKEGFYRDDNENCVAAKDCTGVCEANEVLVECSTLCGEKTCDNDVERYCGLGPCQPKCHCKKRYVRDASGKCIKSQECPSSNPCNLPIVVGPCRGSFPRYGYDTETKQCKLFFYGGCDGNANNFEKLEDCEAKCEKKPVCSKKKHEVYSLCEANGCQATCANPTLPQVCRGVCTEGCICEEGYIRDSNDKCILPKNCP